MKILEFLALIVLIYFLLRLLYKLAVWGIKKWIAYIIRKKTESFQNDFFGRYYGTDSRSAASSNGSSAPKQKKKVITRDMGEYVEFEEIQEVSYSEHKTESAEKKGKIKEEPRITDVKWEDI